MPKTYRRPVPFDEHPVVRVKYLVSTPTIDEVVARIVNQIRYRNPGAILYGYPRFGKTSSINYVIRYLQEEYPGAVCVHYRCESHKTPSEDAFFCAMLAAVGHKEPLAGKIARKRLRLPERIAELVDRSGRDWIVFFADEAQKLRVEEYEWLRDVHDSLEQRQIRMITILVGQPQILDQKSSFRQSRDTQIVLRFMVTEMRFGGLVNPQHSATVLAQYDDAIFPAKTAWSYTRFFFPEAFGTGMRLADEGLAAWSAFERAHATAGFNQVLEIPMAYFSRAVEYVLKTFTTHDASDFRLSAAMWDEAVQESTFVLAMEEVRQGLPLPPWK